MVISKNGISAQRNGVSEVTGRLPTSSFSRQLHEGRDTKQDLPEEESEPPSPLPQEDHFDQEQHAEEANGVPLTEEEWYRFKVRSFQPRESAYQAKMTTMVSQLRRAHHMVKRNMTARTMLAILL